MPSPVNVAAHLVRMAAEFPDRPALHVPARRVSHDGHTPHHTFTFAQLNADTDALAHGLESIGVRRGARVALMVPPSRDFFALTFALLKVAAVPVLIDPGMGVKNLGKCLADAEPEAFVGVAKAHLARRLFGWAKKTVRVTVNVGRWRFFCTRSIRELRRGGGGFSEHLPSLRGGRREAAGGESSGNQSPLPAASLPTSPQRGEVEGRGPRPYAMPAVVASDPAAILFTSGSTGVAKGAEYTHGIFAAQVEMLKGTYGIQPGEVDLCTFPLFALFGPALGMTGVVPDMDATRPATMDPKKAVAQIRQFGVTNLFGSPAVIRNLASLVPDRGPHPVAARPPSPSETVTSGDGGRGLQKHNDDSLSVPGPPLHPSSQTTVSEGEGLGVRAFARTLRRVISAGAPATPAVLERFVQLLPPGVQVFTPYGATEALPVSNIGSDEILTETRHLTDQGRGVCVGRPVNGITVHVVPISDEPIPTWDAALCLPPNQVGEFVVRGPVVTQRYFHRDKATKLAKIHDPATGETLHRMGDVGYIDEQGRMWFAGRKSHRVETPHGTLFTDMVEPVFNTADFVKRTALVGVRRGAIIHPVVCVELEPAWGAGSAWKTFVHAVTRRPGLILDAEAVWDLARCELRSIAATQYRRLRIKTFLCHRGKFPVDVRHNSKIFREKLAAWADQQLGPDWKPEEPL